jgi:hypothetical protein
VTVRRRCGNRGDGQEPGHENLVDERAVDLQTLGSPSLLDEASPVVDAACSMVVGHYRELQAVQPCALSPAHEPGHERAAHSLPGGRGGDADHHLSSDPVTPESASAGLDIADEYSRRFGDQHGAVRRRTHGAKLACHLLDAGGALARLEEHEAALLGQEALQAEQCRRVCRGCWPDVYLSRRHRRLAFGHHQLWVV